MMYQDSILDYLSEEKIAAMKTSMGERLLEKPLVIMMMLRTIISMVKVRFCPENFKFN